MPGWSMLDKDPHSRAVLGRHEYGGPAPPSSPIRRSEEPPHPGILHVRRAHVPIEVRERTLVGTCGPITCHGSLIPREFWI